MQFFQKIFRTRIYVKLGNLEHASNGCGLILGETILSPHEVTAAQPHDCSSLHPALHCVPNPCTIPANCWEAETASAVD